MSENNPKMLLKCINLHNLHDNGLVFPYSDKHDMIDGSECHTVGLMRMPLMDDDIISDKRRTMGRYGQEKEVCNIYLMHDSYMIYYMREFIFDDDINHVVQTSRGHYGDMLPIKVIAENMVLGKKLVDRARRLYAAQLEREVHEQERRRLSIIDKGETVKSYGDIPSFDFKNL